MSEFVEQCRAEWRRLGVADPLAEEMATDLASDLEEAEAEGVSAVEYLGRSLSDPRSFAASWAAERGIIPPPPGQENDRRRPLALLAFPSHGTREPRIERDGLEQQHDQNEARGQKTVDAAGVKAEIEAPGIEHRAQGHIAEPGNQNDHKP